MPIAPNVRTEGPVPAVGRTFGQGVDDAAEAEDGEQSSDDIDGQRPSGARDLWYCRSTQ